jgi:multicomponent Na+:H+ antiporter subunit E
LIVARSLLIRTAILAAGWWILTEGDPAGIGFGIGIVALAVVTSLWLAPPVTQRYRPLALIQLALYFLVSSMRGGVDVARRAFSPRLPLSPGIRRFSGELPPGPARDTFAGMLTLMPGTLAVDRTDEAILVHTLVDTAQVDDELRTLERRIARALGPHGDAPGGDR